MTEVVNEKLLEERLVALEGARQWSPRVVSRLEAVIRSGKDDALFRINPVKFVGTLLLLCLVARGKAA